MKLPPPTICHREAPDFRFSFFQANESKISSNLKNFGMKKFLTLSTEKIQLFNLMRMLFKYLFFYVVVFSSLLMYLIAHFILNTFWNIRVWYLLTILFNLWFYTIYFFPDWVCINQTFQLKKFKRIHAVFKELRNFYWKFNNIQQNNFLTFIFFQQNFFTRSLTVFKQMYAFILN